MTTLWDIIVLPLNVQKATIPLLATAFESLDNTLVISEKTKDHSNKIKFQHLQEYFGSLLEESRNLLESTLGTGYVLALNLYHVIFTNQVKSKISMKIDFNPPN